MHFTEEIIDLIWLPNLFASDTTGRQQQQTIALAFTTVAVSWLKRSGLKLNSLRES